MFMSRKTKRPTLIVGLQTASALTAFLFSTALPVEGSDYALCAYDEPNSWISYGISQMSWDNMLVMLALAIMAFYAIVVTIERSVTYQTSHRENTAFESVALTALYYNRPLEVFEIATRFKRSPIAAVVASCSSRTGMAALVGSDEHSPDPAAALIAQETSLKEGLMSLALIGRTAPLLGVLLGALVVIERTWGWFRAEASGCYVFSSAVPPAGVGLVFGLLVGIFATWASCLLSSRAEQILLETNRLAPSILARARRQLIDERATAAISVAEGGLNYSPSVSPSPPGATGC